MSMTLRRGALQWIVLMLMLAQPVHAKGTRSVLPRGTRVLDGAAAPAGETESSDELVAGAQGVSYQLHDGVRIQLAAHSRFRFAKPIKLQLGKPGELRSRARVLELSAGRVDVQVPDVTLVAFMVNAPMKFTAVTKQAGRSVTLIHKDTVTTAALDGQMLLGVHDRWKALEPGQARTVSAAIPSGQVAPLMAAPSPPSVKKRLLLQRGDVSPDAELTWAKQAGARRYEVVLFPDVENREPIRVYTNDTHATFHGVPAGVYQAKVRAFDDRGLESPLSSGTVLRVLGLDLPPGAIVTADQTILLPRFKSVALVGAKGLEIAYGKLDRYSPAPAAVGLAHHRPAHVILRDPKTHETAQFSLEPLEIKAKVVFLSRRGFPRGGLPIHVRLFNAGGRSVPPGFEVTARVTIDVDPVELTWKRDGNNLSTRVPKPGVVGPWVVRVEVLDRAGNLVGRDFVELINPSRPRKAPKKKSEARAHD